MQSGPFFSIEPYTGRYSPVKFLSQYSLQGSFLVDQKLHRLQSPGFQGKNLYLPWFLDLRLLNDICDTASSTSRSLKRIRVPILYPLIIPKLEYLSTVGSDRSSLAATWRRVRYWLESSDGRVIALPSSSLRIFRIFSVNSSGVTFVIMTELSIFLFYGYKAKDRRSIERYTQNHFPEISRKFPIS